MNTPYLVLGLDIGIGSCGWALLDMANKIIVDMGVHLWDVPQESKSKQSLAAVRRAARSSRRNTKRTSDRAKHCLELLIEYGFVPSDATKQWIQTVKGDPQPLESRVAALDSLIDNRHFAQALYNLCIRRGYIPHGEGSDVDVEGKKVLSAISENEMLMQENGWRTAGEMMLAQGRLQGREHGLSRNKDGDYVRCVRMSQLLDEAKKIIAAQRSFGNDLVTQEFQDDFLSCMSWEKDTKDHDEKVYQSVANCIYFPELKAAARACLSFELCSAFERVNHIRIVDIHGTEKCLPVDVKRWCMETLFSPKPLSGNKECKITYARLRKKMDLSAHFSFKGVKSEEESKTEIAIPKIWRLERKQLSYELMEKMLACRELADDIGSALAYASKGDVLKEKLFLLDLTSEEVEALCTLPFTSKAFSGYGTRSVKALQMLVEMFETYEEIETLYDAEKVCGLYAKRTEPFQKGFSLPAYQEYDPTNNNPVVLRVMARVRKLVNAVIKEYGMPNEIHVELANELKRSEKEKRQIQTANKNREAARDSARKTIAEFLGIDEAEVSGELIRKKMLWDEQEGRDLYSNAPIEFERMIRDATYCQIDHILPYSRTCDDSQSNKILVLAKSNQVKREKSPYEWLEPLGKWEEFEKRVRTSNKLPYKKMQKLLEKDLSGKQDDFIQRNLNDTRYATRAAMNYIDAYLAFPEDGHKRHVYAVAGGATATLRHAWGFEAKNREANDCHHAMDAAVIAACSQSTVIKVAKASEQKYFIKKEERKALLKDSEPWSGFSNEVQVWVDKLIPTRRVEHGGTARLFEDTTYKYLGLNDKGNKVYIEAAGKKKITGNYVVREDGSVVLPDGMMMLRLWWDGKKYLKEPVYYADVNAIRNESYVPRYFATNAPRPMWAEIPAEVIERKEVVELRYGVAVQVGNEIFRFKGINIDGGTLKFAPMRNFNKEAKPKEGLSKAQDASFVKVMNEDILGLCYKNAKR